MKFIVYTKENCQWCRLTKEFLTERAHEFEEKHFLVDFSRDELQQLLGPKTTRLTLPQTTDNVGNLIGGYEALKEYIYKMEGKTDDKVS